ncbi:MAG: hypothetical protein HY327_02325 [Chloroflexi bacterium]|nr:hypothetical protein [Chloroflexota bacterium]
MYTDVRAWLESVLKERFPKSGILVADTSRITLSRFLEREGMESFFPNYETYEINVDVTGVVRSKNAKLALVECKVTTLTLRDLSQLHGYSQVAQPIYSLLISPKGVSRALNLLLQIYRRYDLLEYADGQRIKIGVWDATRKTVDPTSIIPPGEHF